MSRQLHDSELPDTAIYTALLGDLNFIHFKYKKVHDSWVWTIEKIIMEHTPSSKYGCIYYELPQLSQSLALFKYQQSLDFVLHELYIIKNLSYLTK